MGVVLTGSFQQGVALTASALQTCECWKLVRFICIQLACPCRLHCYNASGVPFAWHTGVGRLQLEFSGHHCTAGFLYKQPFNHSQPVRRAADRPEQLQFFILPTTPTGVSGVSLPEPNMSADQAKEQGQLQAEQSELLRLDFNGECCCTRHATMP